MPRGVPLAVAVSGANLHDSLALKPLILGIPAVRSRRGPRRRRPVKLRADKAYFSAEHLSRLRERGLVARIARPGTESGERLGRRRWKIERSIAWLFGYRRLTIRYERKGSHFLAFLGLAAALTCSRSSPNLPRETPSECLYLNTFSGSTAAGSEFNLPPSTGIVGEGRALRM